MKLQYVTCIVIHNELHLLMGRHSEAVLIQSCKVYILPFFYLTVKCNSLQIIETQLAFVMKHGGHYSSKNINCISVEH